MKRLRSAQINYKAECSPASTKVRQSAEPWNLGSKPQVICGTALRVGTIHYGFSAQIFLVTRVCSRSGHTLLLRRLRGLLVTERQCQHATCLRGNAAAGESLNVLHDRRRRHYGARRDDPPALYLVANPPVGGLATLPPKDD
jgi:hypothetical protein